MDYSLAALKLLCCQLKDARPTTSSPSAMTLYGILFQRAWLQGVLVSGCEEGRFVLDDGSDVIELGMCSESGSQEWKTGMYVMVVGHFVAAPAQSGGLPLIKVHKIVDLSGYPDREAMWHFEVIEAYKLFYVPSVE
ncbi:uncharacterized protein LOC103710189 isoform X4 [Phoenix dactylifera]|uniref:Uncharacterized protein LOC103710189 isoform X4 n=1 Tax=Phoenix dactylifera TaxID=42345 RepID=A0A8B7C8K9_PHODC|nr:uncharacterized protein LOC103710189 isoform X4 [Phoenix dactylifera]